MTVGTGALLYPAGGTISANQINLGAMPTSQPCIGTNSSGQPIAGTCGGGSGTANVPTATFSTSTATFFAACSSSSPCPVSKGGSQVDQIQATNTLTAPGSGTGAVYVYWTTSGPIVGSATGVAITIGGSGPLTGTNTQGITAFPASATALISTLQYSSAAWTSVTNYQPTAANLPVIAVAAGLTSTPSGGTQTIAPDTSVLTTHSSLTQNFVPHADATGYNLVNGLIQDDGTKVGINGPATGSYTFMVNGNTTSTVYMGIANADATNTGSSGFCLVNNGGASFGCWTQNGTSTGGGSMSFNSNGDIAFAGTSEVARFLTGGGFKLATASQPSCAVGIRGTFWYVAGGAGVKDSVQVCTKDASDAYAWRTIY
jgi:hypothetical protein